MQAEIKQLAIKLIERAEALELTGRHRDISSLEFVCGAASCAELLGNLPLRDDLIKIAWSVSVHGYSEILGLVKEEGNG